MYKITLSSQTIENNQIVELNLLNTYLNMYKLVFYDENYHKLSYWIKDYINKIILVKIPTLLYKTYIYVNDNSINSSNIDNIALFGDDFSESSLNTSKWQLGGVSGSNYYPDITFNSGIMEFSKQSQNQNIQYGIHQISNIESSSFILKSRIQLHAVKDTIPTDIFSLYPSPYGSSTDTMISLQQVYDSSVSTNQSKIQVTYKDSSSGNWVYHELFYADNDKWYTYEIIRLNSTTFNIKVYDDTNNLIASYTQNPTIVQSFYIDLEISPYGGNTSKYDYVILLPYYINNITINSIKQYNYNVIIRKNISTFDLSSNIQNLPISNRYIKNIFTTYNWNLDSMILNISNTNNIISPTSYSNVLRISPFVHFNDYNFKIQISNDISLYNLISFKIMETQLQTIDNSLYLKINEILDLKYDFNIKFQNKFYNLLYDTILHIIQSNNIITYTQYFSLLTHISNSYFINEYSNLLTLNLIQKNLYSYLNKLTNQEFSIVYYSIKIPITDLYFNYHYSSVFSNIQILFTDYSLLLHESQKYEIHNYSIDFYFKKMLFIDKIIRKYVIIPNLQNIYRIVTHYNNEVYG